MLSQLTTYLIQHGRVFIPHVGAFEIVQTSPQFDVAARSFLPPSFTTAFQPDGMITQHQAEFFSKPEDMDSFGIAFKKHIHEQAFEWKGIGILKGEAKEIRFEPALPQPKGWTAVPAERVVRDNARHSMLVGDQQMTAAEVSEALGQQEALRSLPITIGWVLFIVAMLAIIILLYIGKFQPSASGLRW